MVCRYWMIRGQKTWRGGGATVFCQPPEGTNCRVSIHDIDFGRICGRKRGTRGGMTGGSGGSESMPESTGETGGNAR